MRAKSRWNAALSSNPVRVPSHRSRWSMNNASRSSLSVSGMLSRNRPPASAILRSFRRSSWRKFALREARYESQSRVSNWRTGVTAEATTRAPIRPYGVPIDRRSPTNTADRSRSRTSPSAFMASEPASGAATGPSSSAGPCPTKRSKVASPRRRRYRGRTAIGSSRRPLITATSRTRPSPKYRHHVQAHSHVEKTFRLWRARPDHRSRSGSSAFTRSILSTASG